jgi:glycosyltransferase involved in cell wall biosynthesis
LPAVPDQADVAPAEATAGPLRVAAFTHTLVPSGAELALSRTAPHLGDQEFELSVIFGADGPVRKSLVEQAVSTVHLPLPHSLLAANRGAKAVRLLPLLVAYGRSVLRLARLIRREGFVLVHANSLKSALIATPACWLAGVPVVWHLRDQLTREYLGRRAPVIRSLCRWASSAVVANSWSTLGTLGRYAKPSGVSYSPLSPDIRFRAREYHEGPLNVLMLGRLAPWKGQLQVLTSLARSPDSWGSAVFAGGALFGEQAYERALAQKVEELGLVGRVRFVGHVDDPGRLFDEADVLIHASVIPEPLGQVVLEGVAAGVPVLASNAGGPAEVLEHGVTALLHEPGNVDELAAHLSSLAADPALRRLLVENGRGLVEQFGAPEAAGAIRSVWRQAIGSELLGRRTRRGRRPSSA